MRTFRGAWSFAGLVAGGAGLAASYFVATVLSIRDAPVVAISELIIELTPGSAVEKAIQVLGHQDKLVLVLLVLAGSAGLFALAGQLAARSVWAPRVLYGALAALATFAVLHQRGTGVFDLLPVVVGLLTWVLALQLLTEPLHRARRVASDTPVPQSAAPDHTRRSVLVRGGTLAVLAAGVAFLGRGIGRGRRQVEESRRLLRLSGVSAPMVPVKAHLDVEGISSWMTPNESFYRIHTAIVVPTIEPTDWQLRIHGMVDREIVLSYEDLVNRELTESWITLNCVSNPIGGPLIGNAWWSGVRIADVLAEAGVQAGADAVLQTSHDGWTCGTPLEALTDTRNAMLALSMNGEPLPIDHGFPVRTIVPGLYGYVSATKWVVDMKVTRFDKFDAYWTKRGWGEFGPVKLGSRVDVPRSDAEVSAGSIRVGGVAWAQHTGVQAVEVAVDGGAWQSAELAQSPTNDSWLQWAATLDVGAGDHTLRVRATDKTGQVQTGVNRDVLPDGATGWHTVAFRAV